MGSLNDYGQYQALDAPKRRGFRRRLMWQIAVSLILFFLVAAAITADNRMGDAARYVAGPGLDAENSWIDFGRALPALAGAEQEQAPPAMESAQPQFTAPASGIVVTDLAVAVSGFASEQGILIQGNPGQSVKAAASGDVIYLGESEDGYIVELEHSGGFSSIYQGLSQIDVAAGDTVVIGAPIGVTASGEVTFSLLKDDAEVSPLEYLFQN